MLSKLCSNLLTERAVSGETMDTGIWNNETGGALHDLEHLLVLQYERINLGRQLFSGLLLCYPQPEVLSVKTLPPHRRGRQIHWMDRTPTSAFNIAQS